MARRLAAAVLIVCTSAAALASPLLSNARLSAALFDIDGTLFNSDALHLLAFQELLQEEGFNGGERISEAFFLENISGRQNSQIVRDLFPERTAAQGADFSDRKEAKFRELAAAELSGMVTPGLEALLGTLEARGVRCAAVTNAPRANAELMLGAIGRLGWFEPLIIGDECTAGKPDPEPYLRAMRELGVLPGECLAFEDSPSGARAAVAAGLRTVGITSTQPAAVLVEGAGCAYAIADFTETALAREVEERAGRVLLTRPKLWLLDRDGCLNIDVGAPGVVRLDQLQLLPGSAGALRRLRLAGPVAIITNQSGRGRGLLTAEGLEAIHERLRHLVATTARGGRVGREQWDGLYVCEDAHPSTRKKPAPGMVVEACADFGCAASEALLIGDSWSDVVAAQRAGAVGVLVTTGHGASLAAALRADGVTLPTTLTGPALAMAAENRSFAPALGRWWSGRTEVEAALIDEAMRAGGVTGGVTGGVRVYRDLAQAVDELTALQVEAAVEAAPPRPSREARV